jgi:hypothetical protein
MTAATPLLSTLGSYRFVFFRLISSTVSGILNCVSSRPPVPRRSCLCAYGDGMIVQPQLSPTPIYSLSIARRPPGRSTRAKRRSLLLGKRGMEMLYFVGHPHRSSWTFLPMGAPRGPTAVVSALSRPIFIPRSTRAIGYGNSSLPEESRSV